MDISKLNNTLLYSNKNVEKTARKLINESANAVLMEMFDDKVILADHQTGQIFEAEYSFDGNVFEFSNFDEIQLEKSSISLKEAISDYFDDCNISLTESYEKAVENTTDVFENSLTEALAGKNIENVIDYSEIAGINEELEELKNNKTFKLYTERLQTKPTSSIKFFDWKKPVRVALIDEDVNKTINKSASIKAKKLKKDADFRKSIVEASTQALKGNTSLLEDLIYENTCLLSLSDSELKEMIGLSLVTDKTLMENRNNIFKTIQTIISEDSVLAEKRNVFTEAEQLQQGQRPDENGNAIKTSAETEEDAPEASEEDTEAIVKALEKAKELAKDEKLVDKIEKLISSLDSAASEGETDVEAVKESIELLSL